MVQENGINPYIWCVVGGVVGWLAGQWTGATGRVAMIENVLVGIFGAFIGGDFVVAMLTTGVVDGNIFRFRSLAMAVAGAAVLLLLLWLMRQVIGPMRPSKRRTRPRS